MSAGRNMNAPAFTPASAVSPFNPYTMQLPPPGMSPIMPNMMGHGAINGNDTRPVYHNPGTVLFVGNLPFSTPWQSVKDHFRSAGAVRYTDLIADRDGRPKGSALVTMMTPEEATIAINRFNETYFEGRRLIVRHFDDGPRPSIVQRGMGPSLRQQQRQQQQHQQQQQQQQQQQMAAAAAMGMYGNSYAAAAAAQGYYDPATAAAMSMYGNAAMAAAAGLPWNASMMPMPDYGSRGAWGAGGMQTPPVAMPKPRSRRPGGNNQNNSASNNQKDGGAGGSSGKAQRGPSAGGAPYPGAVGRTLFVSNLPFGCTKAALRETLEQIGVVESVAILQDAGGRSRGQAIVVMATADEALLAIKEFDGIAMAGRPMKVRFDTKTAQSFGPAAQAGAPPQEAESPAPTTSDAAGAGENTGATA